MNEPKVDQRHRETLKDLLSRGLINDPDWVSVILAKHFPLPPEDRIKELQDSIGAIHYHAKYGAQSEIAYRTKLHSIKEECEWCIPELRNKELSGGPGL